MKATILNDLTGYFESNSPGIKNALWGLDNVQIVKMMKGILNISIVTGIKLEDEKGKTLFGYGNYRKSSHKRLRGEQDDDFWYGGDLIYEGEDIAGQKKIGRLFIYSNRSIIFDRVEFELLLIVFNTLITSILLWLIILLTTRRILAKPLSTLTSAAEKIEWDSVENFQIDIKARRRDELKILEETFNAMIQKIAVSRKKLQAYFDELTLKNNALAESEIKFRKIYENAIEGMFQTTLEGRFLSANNAMAKIFGYASPEQMLQEITNIGTQLYVDQRNRTVTANILEAEGQIVGNEVEFKKADGDHFWGAESTRLVRNKDGLALHYEGTIIDISERKEKEKAEREREAAKAATLAKSEFLAHMSHEIRTPMNAIIGFSGLALKNELPPKIRDYLSKINTSAQTLLGIINDILDFSKIEAGKLVIEQRAFSLEATLNNVINLVGIKVEEKGLELLYNIDPKIPDALIGDSLRLGQILLNLCANAVKFTKKGHVFIDVTFEEYRGDDNDPDRILLSCAVEDTGIGLSQNQIGRLFKSFSQADSSTTRKFGGTGLGLSISKKLVELMGGQIHVKSRLGKGSTFTIRVPLKKQSIEKTITIETPLDLRGKRILVVDDNELSRKLLDAMLTSLSFQVDQVTSGEEALKKLDDSSSEDAYDLILMDYSMPGMDGITASKKLRHELQLTNTPKVLMVTAYGREEIRIQAESAGIDGFLPKPVNQSLLFDSIMEIFGKTDDRLQVKTQQKQLQDHNPDPIRGSHILLVEDNKINQQVASELLESVGLQVSIAENGLEALARIFSETRFDCVLMDIQMPEMDGYETTQIIRKRERFHSLPIIAMTAHAMTAERQKCFEIGMNDHISKPIDQNLLYQKLLQWVVPREGAAAKAPKRKLLNEDNLSVMFPDILSGLNIEKGLARIGGNKRLYLKVLQDFKDQNADIVKTVEAYLEANDRVQLKNLFHSLKGVSGNIGADELYVLAQAVDKHLSNNDQLDGLNNFLAEFKNTVEILMLSINSLKKLGKNTSPAKVGPVTDRRELSAIMDELEGLIERAHPKAREKLDGLSNNFQSYGQGPLLSELKSHLDQFEFEAAQTVLAQLREHSGL